MLQEGDRIPDEIELYDQDNNLRKIKDFIGKRTVFYTYPKDNTPGCTTEAMNFRDSIKEYENIGVEIVGISADLVKSHKKFAEKFDLPFILLSDPEKKFLKLLGAIEGGRIVRRTWLMAEDGKIEKVYEKVSASNHNDELCAYYMKK